MSETTWLSVSHRAYVNVAECSYVCVLWLVKVEAQLIHLFFTVFICVHALAMKFKARYGLEQLNLNTGKEYFPIS